MSGASRTPRPQVAVGGIAFDDAGRVLLIQRGQPPAEGSWSIPGGRIEFGESMVAACQRELREETGLEVEVGEVAVVVDRMHTEGPPEHRYHYVIVDFLVTVVGGTLAPADDVRDARWLDQAELERLPLTEGLRPALDQAREQWQEATLSPRPAG